LEAGLKAMKRSTLTVVSYEIYRMAFAQLATIAFSQELSFPPASQFSNNLGMGNGLQDEGLC